jgi:hypothetical protein
VNPPAYLTALLETGSTAYSSVSGAVLRELESLDLVRIQTHKSRRHLVVTKPDAFADWLDAHYPPAPSNREALLRRAENITQSRNSKSGATTHDIQPVMLKWFGAPDLEPVRLTAVYGLVAATSKRVVDLPWPDVWHLLLVENWESFYALDYPSVKTTIVAIYLAGQVPDVTLAALSRITPPPSTTRCFVDYDWSGLYIYARIRRYFPVLDLYLPPDLESLFAQYARHDLATSQPLFLDDDPATERVIRLIQQYNAGLEQEIVSPPSYAAHDE